MKDSEANPPSLKIFTAILPGHIETARRLFEEYAKEAQVNLCFQNFTEELKSLPGKYAPPKGRLLLAEVRKQIVGCVALREFDVGEGSCEMKRLFVKPSFRRQKIGWLLAEELIAEARGIGYQTMRLDTLGRMKSAVALYEALGFQRTESYRFNPEEDAVYMQMNLIGTN